MSNVFKQEMRVPQGSILSVTHSGSTLHAR